jgi:hypothetical protein
VVVDYVVGRETDVTTMLDRLCQRQQRAHEQGVVLPPVRVLLLERDAGQRWWAELTYDGSVRALLHHPEPLHLTAPDATGLWQIVQQIHRQHQNPLPDDSRARVLTDLTTIDPNRRPLFVILTALAMARGDYNRDWTRDALLQYHLRHDEQLWRKGTDKTLLLKHTNLLALSTMSGGLSKAELKTVVAEKWDFLPDLTELSRGRDLYGRMAAVAPDGTYAPLEPDPYGEFYVLDWLTSSTDDLTTEVAAETFIDWAWATKPDKIAAFVFRAFTTYDGHGRLSMLHPPAPDNCSKETAKHRAELYINFTYWIDDAQRNLGYFEEIKTAHSLHQHPDSQLALAKAAMNIITDASKEEAWRKQASDTFDWLKTFVSDSQNDDIRLELARAATNLIGGLAEDERYRQRASEVFDDLSTFIADSQNDDIRLQLAKAATNLINGLAKDERYRQRASEVFNDLSTFIADSQNDDIRLELAKAATNLINGLAEDERYRQQADSTFDWLTTFIEGGTSSPLLVPFTMSTYSMMIASAKKGQWKPVRAYFGGLTDKLRAAEITPDLYYEYADCMWITLFDPELVEPLLYHYSNEYATQIADSFRSRFAVIEQGWQQFSGEERWQQLRSKTINAEPIKLALRAYR